MLVSPWPVAYLYLHMSALSSPLAVDLMNNNAQDAYYYAKGRTRETYHPERVLHRRLHPTNLNERHPGPCKSLRHVTRPYNGRSFYVPMVPTERSRPLLPCYQDESQGDVTCALGTMKEVPAMEATRWSPKSPTLRAFCQETRPPSSSPYLTREQSLQYRVKRTMIGIRCMQRAKSLHTHSRRVLSMQLPRDLRLQSVHTTCMIRSVLPRRQTRKRLWDVFRPSLYVRITGHELPPSNYNSSFNDTVRSCPILTRSVVPDVIVSSNFSTQYSPRTENKKEAYPSTNKLHLSATYKDQATY